MLIEGDQGVRRRSSAGGRSSDPASAAAEQKYFSNMVIKLNFSALATILVLFISQQIGPNLLAPRIILSLSVFIYVFIILDATQTKGERIFAICFCLFDLSMVVIPGIMQCARGWFSFFSMAYPAGDVFSAATATTTFTVIFAISYWVAISRRYKGRRSISAVGKPMYRLRRNLALVIALALAIYAVAMTQVVGNETFVTRRGDRDLAGIGAFGNFAEYSARYAAFISFVLLARIAVTAKRRWPVLFLTVPAFVLFLYLNNPYNIPRTMVFAYVICFSVAFFPSNSRKFKIVFISLYLNSLLLIAPLLGQLTRGEKGSLLFTNFSNYYTESGDFANFQSTINVIIWVKDTGLKFGNQIISGLFVFIPRAIWKTKAFPTGTLAAEHAGYAYVNVSSPLVSEFYADLGWVGVMLGATLCGWGVVVLDRQAARARQEGSWASLVFFGMFAGYLGIILRGSLGGVMPLAGLAVLMAYSLKVVERRRRRSNSSTLSRGSLRAGAIS